MYSPKLFVAAFAAVSVVGAATLAFAQTTSTQPQSQTGTTGTMERDGQATNSSTTGNTGTATQRTPDSTGSGTGAAGMNSGSTTNQSGTMQNDTTRSSTDSSTMADERAARADRN